MSVIEDFQEKFGAGSAGARRTYLLGLPQRSQAEDDELRALDPDVLTGLDAADHRTHVERINPGPDPAYIPGGAFMPEEPLPPARGIQRLYTMLTKGTHGGLLKRAGEFVMLFDDEVGPHHRLTDPTQAAAPAPMQATVIDQRDVMIGNLKSAMAVKDEALSRSEGEIASRDQQIADMKTAVAAKDEALQATNDKLAEFDKLRDENARLTEENTKLHSELDAATAAPAPVVDKPPEATSEFDEPRSV